MNSPQQKKSINNFTLKVVAVIFALFLWFYVDAQQNPLADQRFDVPISYENLADDLSWTGGNKTVTVTVKGRQDRVSNVRSSDFEAVVDMSAVVLGDNQLEIKVTAPGDVEISTIRPAKTTVTVDRITEMSMEVQYVVQGTLEEGYTRFTPSITPTTVLVKGSEQVLATIAAAKVEIDATGATSNLILNLPVKLLTEDGIIVDNSTVTVAPETVEVFLPVDQETPSKMVAIKPDLVGSLAEGYTISRVVTDPETVKIVGGYNDIDQVDQLQTEPIYVSNITEDLVQEVEVRIPDGVTLMSNNKVKVLVSVTQETLSTTVDIPIVVRGDTEYEVTLSQSTAQVTLEGSAEALADAEALSKIVPYVSISGLEAGMHTVELKLEDESGLHMVQVLPASIEVELTIPEEETTALE